jgi:hypothetical protein
MYQSSRKTYLNQRTLKIIKTKSLALNVYVHFVMKIDWSVFKVFAIAVHRHQGICRRHRHQSQCRRHRHSGIKHLSPVQYHSGTGLSPQGLLDLACKELRDG